MKKLTLEDLEAILKMVVLKLKNENLTSFSFDNDKYWIIMTDEWNDFSKTPEQAVGSLFDDIEYLKNSIKNGEIITFLDFDRVASILRAISENQAPTN